MKNVTKLMALVMAVCMVLGVVPAMAEAAKAFGANGFFFEVHPEPDTALSDGPNMLCLDELESVVAKLL